MAGAAFVDPVGASHIVVEGGGILVAFGFVAARATVVDQVLGDAVCPAVGDGFVGCIVSLTYLWSLRRTVVVVAACVAVCVVGGVARLVASSVGCVLLESCLDDAFDVISSDVVCDRWSLLWLVILLVCCSFVRCFLHVRM